MKYIVIARNNDAEADDRELMFKEYVDTPEIVKNASHYARYMFWGFDTKPDAEAFRRSSMEAPNKFERVCVSTLGRDKVLNTKTRKQLVKQNNI